jgi:hypothetical protein
MRYDLGDTEISTLELALSERMNLDELRRLAALTGEKPPTRKADVADIIVRLLAGDNVRVVWQGLDELQQAAVAEVVHSSVSRFDAGRFRAKYGKDPDWGSADKYGSNRKPSPLCFFFYKGLMPEDLKARLKQFVPPPRGTTIDALELLPPAYDLPFKRWSEQRRTYDEGTEPVPLAVHETEQTAQRELFSVLRLVDAGQVKVSDKTRRPSASTVEAIAAVLANGDYYPHITLKSKWYDENAGPIRAFAWPLLIQAGGLAQLSGTRLQLTKQGRKALSEPASGTIRILWNKWKTTTLLDELARIDCVKGQTGKGKRGLTAVSSRRTAIAGSLAECPSGKWIASDDFRRYMRATGNDFAVAHNAWNLYVCDPQYGSLAYDGSVSILNGRYLLALLLEYVATLGMIDVALIEPAGARRDFRSMWGTDEQAYFSRYDGLMYFRLTPLGAWCLGADSEYRPAPIEAKPVLRVLPNLEIAAAGAELEPGDRMALDSYAIAVSECVWRLDAGKLLAAIEEGKPLDEIREFLTARSGAEIPATVARFLDGVAERSTKILDRGLARLIECAEPALAALIANDTRTRKHCLPAGDRHLVVPASSEGAFRRALRDAGYVLSNAAPHRAPSA